MRFAKLLLKSAGMGVRPKRRPRRSLAVPKDKRQPTPIVVDRGRRVNPKTVRWKRTRKRVAAWREKYGVL